MRRIGTAVVAGLLALAVLVVVGAVLVVRVSLHHATTVNERDRARAVARTRTIAERYAASVVAHSHDTGGPSDAQLHALENRDTRVRTTSRDPELSLVVDSTAQYNVVFGAASVHACYGIDFHGLGSGSPRYELTQQACPVASPTASPR